MLLKNEQSLNQYVIQFVWIYTSLMPCFTIKYRTPVNAYMYIRKFSKKKKCKRRTKEVWKRREKKSVYACARKRERMHASVRVVMHIMHFYALLHLYVLHRLFFVFLFVSSPLFSIINFPLRSFLSLATFYELAETDLPYSSCPSSFLHPSTPQHPIIAQKQQ